MRGRDGPSCLVVATISASSAIRCGGCDGDQNGRCGTAAQGSDQMRLVSGGVEGPYGFRSRMGDVQRVSPCLIKDRIPLPLHNSANRRFRGGKMRAAIPLFRQVSSTSGDLQSEVPQLTNAELVQLRIRVIAL